MPLARATEDLCPAAASGPGEGGFPRCGKAMTENRPYVSYAPTVFMMNGVSHRLSVRAVGKTCGWQKRWSTGSSWTYSTCSRRRPPTTNTPIGRRTIATTPKSPPHRRARKRCPDERVEPHRPEIAKVHLQPGVGRQADVAEIEREIAIDTRLQLGFPSSHCRWPFVRGLKGFYRACFQPKRKAFPNFTVRVEP